MKNGWLVGYCGGFFVIISFQILNLVFSLNTDTGLNRKECIEIVLESAEYGYLSAKKGLSKEEMIVKLKTIIKENG